LLLCSWKNYFKVDTKLTRKLFRFNENLQAKDELKSFTNLINFTFLCNWKKKLEISQALLSLKQTITRALHVELTEFFSFHFNSFLREEENSFWLEVFPFVGNQDEWRNRSDSRTGTHVKYIKSSSLTFFPPNKQTPKRFFKAFFFY
jgi:hypothetical protein